LKHFLHLAAEIDTLPALRELADNSYLWNQNTLRTNHPDTAHKEADDIWLWFNSLHDDVVNDIQTVEYPAWRMLPSLRRLVLDLIHRADGVQLGRCIVTRLRPGAQITPHADHGAPVTFYRRYQIALQSLPGALFNIEDETVNFRTGDVWMINNKAEHSVVNNSADDRIVCIVDIKSA
jgi:hypothetical protein